MISKIAGLGKRCFSTARHFEKRFGNAVVGCAGVASVTTACWMLLALSDACLAPADLILASLAPVAWLFVGIYREPAFHGAHDVCEWFVMFIIISPRTIIVTHPVIAAPQEGERIIATGKIFLQ